jgi:hypothetical protein
MLLAFFNVDVAADGARRAVARVGSPQFDPAGEVGHYRVGQLLLRGHLQPLVPQGLEDQAVFGVTGNDRRARLAPGAQAVAGIDQ